MEETRIGKCQWCEKHNVLLHSVIGQYNGKLWAGWICNDCLETAYQKDWNRIPKSDTKKYSDDELNDMWDKACEIARKTLHYTDRPEEEEKYNILVNNIYESLQRGEM